MPKIVHEWQGLTRLYHVVKRGESVPYLVGEQSRDGFDAMDQPVWEKAENEAKVIAEGVYFAQTTT